MICPQCSMDIPDHKAKCPYCGANMLSDYNFNDYKSDGFVGLKSNDENDNRLFDNNNSTNENTYFKSSRNLIKFSVIFLLVVAVFTIFGYKILQHLEKDTKADMVVAPYVPCATEAEKDKEIKNTVKDVTIKNLLGSWKNLDAKESENYALSYFTFTENGDAQYDHGSFTVSGYYHDYSTDKENVIYLEVENQLTGLFNFDVKGNSDDGYQLSLSNSTTGITYYFETAKAKTYKLKPFKDTHIDKDIIGTWKTKDGYKSYTFTEEGRFVRKVAQQTMNGVWTVNKETKNTLSISFMERVSNTINLNYCLYQNGIIINDTLYYKDDSE